MQFKAYDPGVEVNGQTVLSVVAGMGVFKDMAYEILAENGIENPQPGKWYSQQAWLDSFKAIADQVGESTLLQIGKSIPENADWPPEIDTVVKALSSIDVAYHMNHRNGEIGHYKFEVVDENSGIMTCPNPYPCYFDRGIIESVANMFKPKDSAKVVVTHDDSKPCRKNGDESCTYIISW